MTAALGRVRSGSGDCDDMVVENATVADAAGTRRMRRRLTNPTEIRSAIVKPGDVRINVQGAFIVSDGGDDGQGSNGSNGSNGNDGSNGNNGNNAGNSRKDAGPPETEYEHDSRDIRLPNHTAVVSHVAVDVSTDAMRHTTPFPIPIDPY